MLLIHGPAPDLCLPLATSTILLLPFKLLFTPISSNVVLKITLVPFRYSSKPTEALKLTISTLKQRLHFLLNI